MKKFTLLLIIAICSIASIKASNFYWVGGTGDWSNYASHWATTSGGTIFHTTIPTLNDDVFFDVNSFNSAGSVTLDSTFMYCKNFTSAGLSQTVTIVPLTSGLVTLNVYDNFISSANASWGSSVEVNMLASSGTHTFTSNGSHLGKITFAGSGVFNITDNLLASALSVGLSSNVSTNNHTLDVAYISNSSTVSFNVGSSFVECQDWNIYGSLISNYPTVYFSGALTGDPWNITGVLQFDTIIYTSPGWGGSSLNGAFNCNYLESQSPYAFEISNPDTSAAHIHKGVFPAGLNVNGNYEFDSLLVSSPGQTMNIGGAITINDYLLTGGTCDSYALIDGGIINKSSGTVTVNYVNLHNTIAGGGASFIANNSVDLGGNSGWTINSAPPRNLYWIGGSGNWSDPLHWSLSSGGTGGNCLPTLTDNVFFDAASFTSGGSVTLDEYNQYCKNFTSAGLSQTVTIVPLTSGLVTLNVYDNFISSANASWGSSVEVNMLASSGTHTFTSNGSHLGKITFAGSGVFNITDNLLASALSVGLSSNVSTNNHTLDVAYISNSSTVSFNVGSSFVECQDWNIYGSLISNYPTVYFSGALTGDPWNITGVLQFDTIIYTSPGWGGSSLNGAFNCNYLESQSPYAFEISNPDTSAAHIHKGVFPAGLNVNGNYEFDSLLVSSPGQTMNIGGAITINDYLLTGGTCDSYALIDGGIINKSSGTVTVNYVNLHNTIAGGGASFIANNSVDLGGNSGWTINSAPPRNLYWIGGSGNWSDPLHWSLSSGGTGGNCLPTLTDNVFFDAASFTSGGSVTLDEYNQYCKNFTSAGLSQTVTIVPLTSGLVTLNVYDNFISSANASWGSSVEVNMLASSGTHTFTSNGSHLGKITFAGSGVFNITDNLLASALSVGLSSNVSTNNHTLDVAYISNSSTVSFNVGSSFVECQDWNIYGSLISNYPTVYFSGALTGDPWNITGVLQFDTIIYTSPGWGGSSLNGAFNCNYLESQSPYAFEISNPDTSAAHIHKGVFPAGLNVNGNYEFDSLLVSSPGQTMNIGGTITINDNLYIESLPGFPAQISGGIISKATGQVCLDYVLLDNVAAIGGAQFFAGSNSVDLGGNSGWSYTNCAPYISNVWPGDANYDLTCDNLDLLNIGLAYGYSGIARTAPTINWVAQLGTDWLQQFVNGANLKHADCDGNGTVSYADTLAISQNYGQIHPLRGADNSGTNSFGAQLYFDVPTTSLQPGSVVTVPIDFGTATAPVSNLYGIAFTVDYDASLIQPNSVSINYTNSWLPTTGSYLHIERDFSAAGKIDMALTRTDHLNASGYGTVANLVFTVANNASGPLQLGFSKIRAVSANELEIPVQANAVSVVTSVNSIDPKNTFTVFPNPFKDQVAVINSNYKTGQPIEVFNIYGTRIYATEFTSEKVLLNTESWRNGVYLIHTGGSVVKVTKTN